MEGIKRLEKMAEGQKDLMLLDVVKYLIGRTDMNEKYLKEEKTLKGMASYIHGEVLKEICVKMNTKDPSSLAEDINYNGKNVRCLGVGMPNERIYELAISYFEKSNEELGIKLKEKKKEIKKNKEDDEFGSIFGTSCENNNKKENIEQISLFVV